MKLFYYTTGLCSKAGRHHPPEEPVPSGLSGKTKNLRTSARFVFTCACLLLLVICLKATPVKPAKDKQYWVTETGPCSNPYTIIRVYDQEDNQVLEILMNGYRLRANKKSTVKRLNRLVNAADRDTPAGIASLLRIKSCRISSVKKT